ncbi:DNA polymerase III subunit gamma/tau [Caldimonas caldifontis]|uniref:DNA polymerase III subunit gamma/tau n=1 Tax=Caldimonas caldifontis TaxID=1452508 RepID=A0A2S5SYL5_9BURK|nr:DNA polymerase III subunit gamma/tau [Caldimonas caldifontis]PPE67687.1 DNA polymerase III subunit gamma/tau [Caldimonas caldifontis]
MSYLVLARKYRPRTFEQMVGQEHVVQALSNALTQQRLHHAYLFTGTRGVGKTTVSRILAKSLNCVGPDGQGTVTATPCGVCQACTDIDAGRFVDYVELDAASNRGVDEISQLLDQAVYKPVVGRFKVYMIDEVHMLSNHAFNAMLKTLEEPPEYLKFVLATTDPQKVPPTVLSRCLQFNLRPMAPETVLEHLQHVLAAEQISAERGALRLLARAARGSMRDALSLTDQAIAFGSGTLSEAGVRQMLGAVDRGHVVRLLEALAAGDGVTLLATVDEMRVRGLAAAGALEEMATILQELAVLQVVPEVAQADDPDAAMLQALAQSLPPEDTQLLYSIALQGRNELGLAPDEYGGLTMALLRMLAFRPLTPGSSRPPAAPLQRSQTATTRMAPRVVDRAAAPAAVESATAAVPPRQAVRPAAPEAAAAGGDVPPWDDDVPLAPHPTEERQPAAPRRAEPQPAVIPSVQSTPLGDRWQALTAQMIERELVAALVRELALQSQCVAVDDTAQPPRWQLRVERETLASANAQARLAAALAEVLGHPVRLEVLVGATDDTPARRDAAAKARRQQEAEAVILNDPYVQALMSEFSTARVVPGSIKPL